ncbi:MAG: biotin--[acetyl-CoA-carboxylase] ligase [Methanothrix sp.]|nr:biotin--[acetyl-CoA-carboxylase] ligase [Methanothrix sp.]
MAAFDILSFLISGEWVSGEEIAKRLAISRAAVWKKIQALRKRGYEISASTGKGYHLTKMPDLLDADLISGCLKTKWLGRELRILGEVSSSNAAARSLARDCPSGTVILAETQTEGRGRLSRPWASPPGGIWMSLILKPEMPLAHVYQINMAVAVALCRALSSMLGLKAGIKWPNDLLIRERKICGILMEVSAQVDRLDYAVVGLGINANNDPSGFPAEWRSTSLAAELGHDIGRCELICRILEEIEVAYEKMGSKEIYEEWRSRSLTINRQVRITSAAGDHVGEVVDLAEDGALIFREGDELKRVLAGDCIHLRPLDAEAEAL